ncbi:hypothetical protein TNIN_77921 [Trichonephila inaurata madagascariensis]|uniref:Uncharacterized protein n=1 Tax=Trichonephila inaurata madagascariensis TaxID=2747483 RepID=A0A8X7BPG6_9ARAC|nr:hypothetical protein TNIN_77921 [Trichonephila inaurata madagascariensis]
MVTFVLWFEFRKDTKEKGLTVIKKTEEGGMISFRKGENVRKEDEGGDRGRKKKALVSSNNVIVTRKVEPTNTVRNSECFSHSSGEKEKTNVLSTRNKKEGQMHPKMLATLLIRELKVGDIRDPHWETKVGCKNNPDLGDKSSRCEGSEVKIQRELSGVTFLFSRNSLFALLLRAGECDITFQVGILGGF